MSCLKITLQRNNYRSNNLLLLACASCIWIFIAKNAFYLFIQFLLLNQSLYKAFVYALGGRCQTEQSALSRGNEFQHHGQSLTHKGWPSS